MKVIKRICDVIDLVNDWIGRIASFAVLGILAVIVTEVVLRRLFHSPQIWTMDVILSLIHIYTVADLDDRAGFVAARAVVIFFNLLAENR